MDFDLSACLAGDGAAWDAFVERFSGVIYAAVMRAFKAHGKTTQDDLEDTAQDVFVRLIKDDYKLLRSFDPAKASITTWLTIVARSVAIDRLRRKTPPTTPLGQAHLHLADPAAGGATDHQPLLASLPPDLLSARQKLVLSLIFDRQMEVPQIAQFLGVDEQTVRSTKHKAIQKLRDHLGAKE